MIFNRTPKHGIKHRFSDIGKYYGSDIKLRNKTRSVSNIVTTIVLMAITIGAATLAYSIAAGYVNTGRTNASLTVTSTTDTVGTLFGWPIWTPPVQSTLPGGPTYVSVSANYTINYLGIALLVIAAIMLFLSHKTTKSIKPVTATA